MATVALTKDTFEQTVTDNDIVIVDFWAAWCGPCRQFAPIFDKASGEHQDVVFGKVDTDAEQEIAAMMGIRSIPTVAVFREKVLLFAQPGVLSGAQLDDLLGQVKALDMAGVHAQVAEQAAAGA